MLGMKGVAFDPDTPSRIYAVIPAPVWDGVGSAASMLIWIDNSSPTDTKLVSYQ